MSPGPRRRPSAEPRKASVRKRLKGAGWGRIGGTRRYPYALVAWHDQPVGIDIERIEPFDRDFLESIATPDERQLEAEREQLDEYIANLWCSKEALTKALGDAVQYDPRRLQSPMLWPGGRSGPWRARALQAPSGHTAWLCWREHS